MKTLRQGLRLRSGLRVRDCDHESSVAVQNLDRSRRVKVGQGGFLRFPRFDGHRDKGHGEI
jgi:hypothetical protein